MSENEFSFKRWYDVDRVVSTCIRMLENLDESQKNQTASFLMEKIIKQPPFSEMLPEDVFNLINKETRKRRWYDYNETTRIFVELLRQSPDENRKDIAIWAITFIEDLEIERGKLK